MYAYNLAVIARSPGCLQQSLDALHKTCAKCGTSISIEKN